MNWGIVAVVVIAWLALAVVLTLVVGRAFARGWEAERPDREASDDTSPDRRGRGSG